ncbi:Hypothetical predicted protein [Octopus vulgaris]|uniref:Uncharacterized protein n=1 Tax=Octopus vulgaris TaxID=6645 RepID=A0AA36B4P3_OCTVU|nr:Hypothetical predicted protein [Octopus vulgaris]
MELKETRFYKLLQFYGKINISKKSLMNISLKFLKCKNICISASYILCIAATNFTRSDEYRYHELYLELLNKIFKQHRSS